MIATRELIPPEERTFKRAVIKQAPTIKLRSLRKDEKLINCIDITDAKIIPVDKPEGILAVNILETNDVSPETCSVVVIVYKEVTCPDATSAIL